MGTSQVAARWTIFGEMIPDMMLGHLIKRVRGRRT